MFCELLLWCDDAWGWFWFGLTATDWIVVRVVVRDRTEGAGDEKVLSPPILPLAVLLVPAMEEVMCDGAMMDWQASPSVPATERPPAVGGAAPSTEDWSDVWLRPSDRFVVTPVCVVEREGWLW